MNFYMEIAKLRAARVLRKVKHRVPDQQLQPPSLPLSQGQAKKQVDAIPPPPQRQPVAHPNNAQRKVCHLSLFGLENGFSSPLFPIQEHGLGDLDSRSLVVLWRL